MSNVVTLRAVGDDDERDTLDIYTEYLYGEGLSPKTIRVYTRIIKRTIGWLAEYRQTTIDDAGAYDVVELARMIPQSRSSLTQLRASLAHYWTMTGRARPPLKAIRLPDKGEMVSRALSEEEARAIVTVAMDHHPEGTAVMLGLYLALRVGEIARVRWDGFDEAMEWYSVTNIKGGAVDRLPVHPALREHLLTVRKAYAVLGGRVDVWMFPGLRSRDFVTETTIWNYVREVAAEAGVENIHTHRLRHTALTVANDTTGDLRAVSKFARHRRVETTMAYTRSTAQALTKVMESLDYGAGDDPLEPPSTNVETADQNPLDVVGPPEPLPTNVETAPEDPKTTPDEEPDEEPDDEGAATKAVPADREEHSIEVHDEPEDDTGGMRLEEGKAVRRSWGGSHEEGRTHGDQPGGI